MSKLINWNASIMIALFAVFISTFSAYISYKESRIMSEQQRLLTEQQQASVWPYLEHTPHITWYGDTSVTFQYVVTNKGVGPAIIDSVRYVYDNRSIAGYDLHNALSQEYPDLEIKQLGNSMLDGNVLAPEENHVVTQIKISKSKNDRETKLGLIVNYLPYHIEYCYCSIYGKCWKVWNNQKVTPSTDCTIREGIL